MAVLEVNSLEKVYTTRFGGNKVEALRGISFTVEEGEYVAIMGESGSGKTTLLNILAMIDKSTGGKVLLEGRDLSTMKDKDISGFRRSNLGYIFQDFNLLDTLNIRDNIFLPLVLANENHEKMESAMVPIVKELGIDHLLNKFPYEISGGEKQRAAIARALIINPKLILADEPTGALDSRHTEELLQYLKRINLSGQTILMVTHSVKVASNAGRVLFIRDGVLFHQLFRGERTNEQMYEEISNTLTMLSSGGRVSQ